MPRDPATVDLAETAARLVAETPDDALPPETVRAAKRLMLDTLAVAWAGSDGEGSDGVADLMRSESGRAEADLWGFGGERLSVAAATFVNGLSAAALDFDSFNEIGAAHADIAVLPAALAAAQRRHVSGQALLAAFVLGNEVACRIGYARGRERGWFLSSVCGTFGAAAATARVLGLDADGVRNALGIAFCRIGGTGQSIIERTLTKRMLTAFAARSGVESGLLAGAGITAPREVFEGTFGYFALFEDGGRPERFHEDLGRRWLHAETSLKKYPCCAGSHAALEAFDELIRAHGLTPDNVAKVEVRLTPVMNRLVGAPFDPSENPQVAAQFSVQYVLACRLLRGRLSVADLEPTAVLDPAIRPIVDKISVTVDEDNPGRLGPAIVVVKASDAQRFARKVDRIPGGPDTPLSDDALAAKARECLARGRAPLSPAGIAALVERIENIEKVADVADLFQGLERA